MLFRPFLPLMFIGDPGEKEAYNVPKNVMESAGNARNEAEELKAERKRSKLT